MSEPAFVARPSLVRLVLLWLASLGFVVLGLWIAGLFGPAPRPAMAWFGWIAAAFFGFCSIGIVPRLFDREDQVSISAEGIRAKQWSDATIAWDAIADLFVWHHRGQQLLVLRLVDSARYPSNRPFAGLAALNRRLTGGDVAISLVGTDRRVDEAMAAVARFRPASF